MCCAEFELTEGAPCLALMDELWGAFGEIRVRNDSVIEGFYCMINIYEFCFLNLNLCYEYNYEV